MLFILSLILVLNLFHLSTCQNVTKECRINKDADTCLMNLLLLGDLSYKFPENKVEMKTHCGLISSHEKCIKTYSNKCLQSFPRQVTSVLAYGVAKTNKLYCSNKRRKDAFIGFGQCANSVKSKTDQCMLRYIDDLQGIENYPEIPMKIPMACCNYYKMKTCILGHVEQKGKPLCQEAQYDEIERVIDGYAYDVLQLLCGDYTEESDKCVKVLPKTPKKLAKQKRPKSMLYPFINILKSLPEQ